MEMWTQFEDNKPKFHGFLDRAALLGEMALISQSNRQFTVKAVGEAVVLKINREAFHRLIGEYPYIADILKRRFESNLAKLSQGLTSVGQDITSIGQ